MSNKETGGPAFPTTKPLEHWGDPNQGMTLRDYFAAKALQGMLAENGGGSASNDDLAVFAYKIADSMLKAREQ